MTERPGHVNKLSAFHVDDKIVVMEVLNPMDSESLLPQAVSESFPLLAADTVRHIDKVFLPLHPDIVYNVYLDENSGKLFTHVATDHPDPKRDGERLQVASAGNYHFKDIVAPGVDDGVIGIVDSDDLEGKFFVKDGSIYHYVANTEHISIK